MSKAGSASVSRQGMDTGKRSQAENRQGNGGAAQCSEIMKD